MSRLLRYITHPQVLIDPLIPVPEWCLSDQGRERAAQFGKLPSLQSVDKIVSSGEKKAIETATIISAVIGIPIEVCEKTHENDRSATGFLKPTEFENVADAFFSSPKKSIRGWETAVHAQSRIVAETIKVLDEESQGDILMVGHGAVGTLLYCYLANLGIDRSYDQPPGGGHMFTYNIENKTIVHAWKSVESLLQT